MGQLYTDVQTALGREPSLGPMPDPRAWSYRTFLRLAGVGFVARDESNLTSLRQLFESEITATALLSRLHSCEEDDPARDIHSRMDELGFDVLAVRGQDGAIYGYVAADELKDGTVREHARVFHPRELISDSTPIIEVLDVLRAQPRVFVVSGNHVFGIVTRADLQKPAVRLVVFGLVTLLESQLSQLVRKFYPDDAWRELLKQPRIDAAQRLYEERVARNEEMDLVDCLQLADKRDLLIRTAETRRLLGFESKTKAKNFLEEIEKVRNRIAHAQDLVTGTTWEELIRLVEELDLLVERVEAEEPAP